MHTRVAVVQLPLIYFSTPQEFADFVRVPIERAAQFDVQLILLPHLTSSMLFGMFDVQATAHDSLEQFAARQNISTRDWLNERAGYVLEFYLHLFQSLAARVEIWLAPGTVLEPEGDALYQTAFLFNPGGEIVGRQRQMQRTRQELEWGVAQGDALRVLHTELGDFGFVIGEDVRYPETARTLASNGANVLLHPAAYRRANMPPTDSTEDASAHVYQDIFHDTQANQTFGVQANLIGGYYHGRSAVYAPVEMTSDKNGILAQAMNDSASDLLFADLDFDALAQARAQQSS